MPRGRVLPTIRTRRFRKPPRPKRHCVRWVVVGLIVAAIVGAGLHWGVPALRKLLNTVSTDDAFVQSHITYASPRVEGVVTEVLVDQDDRVEPGELLVKLDREPFDVAVAQAEASLDEARANVAQSRAQARSQIARARGAYYQRKNAQETLRRQIATLTRPVRRPQEQAGESGAGAEQPQAGRRASAERRHQQGRVRPAEQRPEGGHRGGERGLGGAPADPRPARFAARLQESAGYPQGA